MAGEWIKVDTNLPDKPEVLRIARRLDISKDSVVGKLIRVWGWFDTNSVDGLVDGVVDADIDAIAYQQGFADALVSVGWLVVDNQAEKVTCPNFERHNGESAKKRALKNERQARWRRGKTHEKDEQASTSASTSTSTREEKRRDTPPIPRKRGTVHEFPPGFDRVWSVYPRKVGKDAAAKAFAKRKPDAALVETMVKAIEAQRSSREWQKDGGQFIPHLATWLNGGRWMDDTAQASANDIFAGAM